MSTILDHFTRALWISLATSALLVACSVPGPAVHTAASPTVPPRTGVTASQASPGESVTPTGDRASPGSMTSTPTQNRSFLKLTPAQTSPAFPGLYLPPDALGEATGNTLNVISDLPCSDLMDILASGQWQEVQRKHSDQGTKSDMSELALGSDVAVASFNGVPCQATVNRLYPQTLKAQGPVDASGDSLEYPSMCLSDGQSTTVNMLYLGPGDVRAIIGVVVPMQTGTSAITDIENTGLGIGSSQASLLDLLDMQGDASGGSPPLSSVIRMFNPGPNFQGQVTVKSIDPLVGEVRLSGMQNGSGQEEGITASFITCNHVTKLANPSGPTPLPAIKAAPVALPTDIPLPPNTVLSSNLDNQVINLVSSDTPDVVADYYMQNLPSLGWKLTQDDRSAQTLITMGFTKDQQTLSITLTAKEDGDGSDVLLTTATSP